MLRLLGRLTYFALLGLAAVLAIGPVVGIVAAMLPFALVGLLVWGTYRGLSALLTRRERRPAILDAVAADAPRRPRREWVRRAGRVTMEVCGGAAIAALIAAAVCWESPAIAETMVAAGAAGGVVGYLVGGDRRPAARVVGAECPNGGC